MRTAAVCVALVAVAIGAWFGAALGGWSGLVWALCIALALVALAGGTELAAAPPPMAGRAEPAATPGGYPRYKELSSRLRNGLRDGRYYTNVLAPDLRLLAARITAHRRGGTPTDAQLAAALGEPWQLLAVERGSRDRDDPPSAAEIEAIVTAVERL